MKTPRKLFLTALALLLFPISAQAIFLLDKEFILYMPGGKKATVQVSNLTGKVGYLWEDNHWVSLPQNSQKYYQRLYELQKDRDKRKERKFQKNYHKPL
ncbi:MAG: hypothetical protein PHS37_10315 [Candidatus Omnitrophica bacterium]|nr:hypothetical protein [Candidatus Omnitrophota bacterium]